MIKIKIYRKKNQKYIYINNFFNNLLQYNIFNILITFSICYLYFFFFFSIFSICLCRSEKGNQVILSLFSFRFLYFNFESIDRYYGGRDVLNQLIKCIFSKILSEKNEMEFFETSEKVFYFVCDLYE